MRLQESQLPHEKEDNVVSPVAGGHGLQAQGGQGRPANVKGKKIYRVADPVHFRPDPDPTGTYQESIQT